MSRLIKFLITASMLIICACSDEEPNHNIHTYTASEQTERIAAKIKEENTETVRVAYATTPLDISATQLPPNYEGYDPEEFFNNAFAVRNQFQKGEFENTKQFQKRIASFQPPPFIKNLNNKGEFAFRVVPYNSTYDADLEEFSFTFETRETRDTVLEKYSTEEDSFHFSVDVLKIKELKEGEPWLAPPILGIILTDSFQRPEELKRHFSYASINLHIPIEEAEDVKRNINLLIILKPKIPFSEYIHRTTDHPLYIPLKLIVGDIVGAWWYNYKTGEIYKKYISS